MKRFGVLGVLAAALSLSAPTSAAAQDEQNFLAVGEMAPDFEVVGAHALRRRGRTDQVERLPRRDRRAGVLLQSKDTWLNDSNASVP